MHLAVSNNNTISYNNVIMILQYVGLYYEVIHIYNMFIVAI